MSPRGVKRRREEPALWELRGGLGGRWRRWERVAALPAPRRTRRYPRAKVSGSLTRRGQDGGQQRAGLGDHPPLSPAPLPSSPRVPGSVRGTSEEAGVWVGPRLPLTVLGIPHFPYPVDFL